MPILVKIKATAAEEDFVRYLLADGIHVASKTKSSASPGAMEDDAASNGSWGSGASCFRQRVTIAESDPTCGTTMWRTNLPDDFPWVESDGMSCPGWFEDVWRKCTDHQHPRAVTFWWVPSPMIGLNFSVCTALGPEDLHEIDPHWQCVALRGPVVEISRAFGTN